MSSSTLLVTCDDDVITQTSKNKSFLPSNKEDSFWCKVDVQKNDSDEDLERLVFLVTKKPKCLSNHLQRIHYCFQHNFNAQLFGAIVDFLVILNQQGSEISWRVVLGAKSRLTKAQFETLEHYLKTKQMDASLLIGNQYSVFTKGLVGVSKMISQIEIETEEDDPLMIAMDHIQYFQLDEAKKVLEDAVLANPERQDLRQELCELYQSTGDSGRFYQMLEKLARLGIGLTDDWNQLNNYFKGQNHNG